MEERQAEAAALIWRLWQTGEAIDALPAKLRPQTRAAGYAIQARYESFSAKPRFGWKIAATSLAGQRHIGVDGPLAGRLLAERIHAPGARLSLSGNRMRVCEPEFGFRFGRTLAPRASPYAVDEVLDAVASLHLTLELPDSRFLNFIAAGGPSLIADNACADRLVVGQAIASDWRALDLARHPVHAAVGRRYEREGVGSNVLGDPRVALTWLANELSGLGIALKEGELITTGTCMVPLEIEPGDRVLADYGPLGRIEASFGT